MEQHTTHERAATAVGPADAALFETLDARLTDLELYTAADGTLFATAPDTAAVVRLTVTDRGLVATDSGAQVLDEADLTPVDRIDPAPESDVTAGGQTRVRGD